MISYRSRSGPASTRPRSPSLLGPVDNAGQIDLNADRSQGNLADAHPRRGHLGQPGNHGPKHQCFNERLHCFFVSDSACALTPAAVNSSPRQSSFMKMTRPAQPARASSANRCATRKRVLRPCDMPLLHGAYTLGWNNTSTSLLLDGVQRSHGCNKRNNRPSARLAIDPRLDRRVTWFWFHTVLADLNERSANAFQELTARHLSLLSTAVAIPVWLSLSSTSKQRDCSFSTILFLHLFNAAFSCGHS